MDKDIQLLSRVVVNHLFLSQFEAFRASLLSLYKRNPSLALSILQTVVAGADRFHGILWSDSCPSPSHLAWLSALELLRFDDVSATWNLDPEILRLKVEFLLLVQIVSSRVSEDLRRFLDLESIEKEEGFDGDFESRPEDLADGTNLAETSGGAGLDSVNLLDRISDLGFRRLKEDIADDVAHSDTVFSFTDAELKCLRKVFLDQQEILDALCLNIQKQLSWSDPFDSGLAISMRAEVKESSAALLPSEEDSKALTWIQQNVQIAHLDGLKDCMKEGDDVSAISHLRFLHLDYGVEESEYRMVLHDIIRRAWSQRNGFGDTWHAFRHKMLSMYGEALSSSCTELAQMIQIIQDELLSEEIEQHRASDAIFTPPPLQQLQKHFGASDLESATDVDERTAQSMAIRSCMRDMYHYARVCGFHTLECVMDTSLSAVRREQLQEASNVLQLFPLLQPLVAVMGWDLLSGKTATRRKLMQLLWTSKSQVLRLEEFSLYGKQSDEMSCVEHLCDLLCYQLDLASFVASVNSGRPWNSKTSLLFSGKEHKGDENVEWHSDPFVENLVLERLAVQTPLRENCSLENGSTLYGFAFLDYATLKFWVGYIRDDASCAALGALLMQVSPKEVIYESQGLSNEAHKALKKYTSTGSSAMQLSPAPPGTLFIDASEVRKLIQSNGYFQKFSSSCASALEDVMDNDLALCALGGLIGHLSRLKLDDALHNGDISPYEVYKRCLRMDGQTLLNLEIFSNNVDGSPAGTLYKHLDNCITSSGKRLLRNWICHPLTSIGEINDRLNVVEGLVKHPEITLVIAQYLRRLPDLERLLGRVKASVGSSAALLLPVVGEKILKQRVKAFGSLIKGLRIGLDLLTIFQKEDHGILSLSTVLNLPLPYGNNGLDVLLTQFEAAVDDDFPHYQDHDVKDSDAETLSVLIKLFAEKVVQWSRIIDALNCVDVLRSFAVTANSSRGSMCRPLVVPADSSSTFSFQETRGPLLMIKGLWHPYAVGENGGELVPNDVYLGKDTTGNCPRTLLLTGPNMGGKSTLLRATCLAVLLAQLGCYVPCEMCVLSPVDIIFTRLGATDRIMSGESTFFVECTETASILRHATQDSLVILDELGRGTSTFDGYAIAYAVFRHLVEKVHCRLLFATHYHPLTKEFASHPHVTLQHMACAFKAKSGSSVIGEQELVFLYRLTSGSCPESYGLQVALMAGIPKSAVESASNASQRMKKLVGENFRSSEVRSEFSTHHEGWLKTLLAVSKIGDCDLDEDASDTLLLLWHELKSFDRSHERKD